ncbi:hypothetical protein EJ08DRAFT_697752 [Tothia fuscella]|uniref:Uncharacterized protein n=1 Tax=Tothia fuscella TaxID=1048955 RepID=A0A9P4NR65_9PEZI|nr:hypothetical protein EJ08DRAFT_697752 [Tothia fuscella]
MAIMINFFRSLFVAAIAIPTAAQDDRAYDSNNHFVSPPRAGAKIGTDKTVWVDNPVYTVGDPLDIKWASNHTSIRIQLFKYGTDQSQIITRSIPDEQFRWGGVLSGVTVYDDRSDDVFFFVAYDADDTTLTGSFYFYSHYFNLTNPPASSSHHVLVIVHQSLSTH